MKKPLVLMILDGFGPSLPQRATPLPRRSIPTWTRSSPRTPHPRLGPPAWTWACLTARWATARWATPTSGAGRIVYQELTRITKSAQDGDMEKNEALLKAMNNAKDNGKALHLMGLLSDGGVHSHNTHLYALLEMG